MENKDLMFRCKASLLIEKINSISSVSQSITNLLNSKDNSKGAITGQLKSVSYNNREVLSEIATLLEFNFSEYLKKKRFIWIYRI